MVQVAEKLCPKCRSKMIILPACCAVRRRGFKKMLKCPRSGCGHKEGYGEIKQ